MDRQLDILTWIHQKEELPKSTGDLYNEYVQDKDYDKSKANFSKILGKLADKDMLERPSYGHYTITERGQQKAEYMLNPDSFEGEKTDTYHDLVNEFEYFLDVENADKVDEAVVNGEDFPIRITELNTFNPELVDKIEENPETAVDALQDAAAKVYDHLEFELVFDAGYFDQPIYEARNADSFNELVTLEGTIDYSTSIKHEIVSILYECVECGAENEKTQDSNQKKKPYKCECGCRKFEIKKEKYQNLIELSLRNTSEENQGIKAVFRPERVDRKLKEAFRPGNKLRLTGIVRNSPIGKKNSKKADPFMDVISYRSMEKEIDKSEIDNDMRNELEKKVLDWEQNGEHPFYKFAYSIAPEISGEEKRNVKEVVAASIIGATPDLKDDGRIHSYIVGNPGEGKSDIIEQLREDLSNIYVADGSNASGVGLTATVESEEGGNYRLKAGKLVFADKGVLAIDEFHDLDPEQTKPLKKAMQQGYFSLDKASQHAELPGRATIIGLANYKEELEKNEMDHLKAWIPEMEHAVRDRFALTYCIKPGTDKDDAHNAIRHQFTEKNASVETPLTSQEMQVYRVMASEKKPVVTNDAADLIDQWVQGNETIADVRGDVEFKTGSNRRYIALYKLATMFARSRFSEMAERRDALEAVKLFIKCRRSMGLSDGESVSAKMEVEA